MAKTEVILTQNIVGLGGESDQVRVAAGYARNYLFPQRFAIPLTTANKKQIEALKKRRAEREAHEFNTMSELAKGVQKLICVIKVKAGEKKIHLEHALKTLGEHEIELHLHPEVKGTLKVRIESTTPAAAPVEVAPPAEAKPDDTRKPRTEKRSHGKHAEAAPEEKKPRAAKSEKPAKAPKAEKKTKVE